MSWNIGHLAWQEQRYWLFRGQSRMLLPDVNDQFANGAPACTPSLDEAWAVWRTITEAADPWLDTLISEQLETPRTFTVGDQQVQLTFGSLMLRTIYHYWYHNGENQAIRQQLLRPSIALVAQRSTREALGPRRSKEGAGVSGEGGSECVVVH